MKTATYIPQVHSFVTFEQKNGLEVGSFESPCAIVHHVGDRVWVNASYCDLPFEKGVDGVMVGDGKTKGFDEFGACIVSISTAHVTGYLTDDEAHDIERCMEADRRLLSYAR